MALNRGSVAAEEGSVSDPDLGFLAFGGIAPVDVTKTSVTVPIQGEQVSAKDSEFFFYTVDIDAYVFPGSDALSTSGQSILDTGRLERVLSAPDPNLYSRNHAALPSHPHLYRFGGSLRSSGCVER